MEKDEFEFRRRLKDLKYPSFRKGEKTTVPIDSMDAEKQFHGVKIVKKQIA